MSWNDDFHDGHLAGALPAPAGGSDAAPSMALGSAFTADAFDMGLGFSGAHALPPPAADPFASDAAFGDGSFDAAFGSALPHDPSATVDAAAAATAAAMEPLGASEADAVPDMIADFGLSGDAQAPDAAAATTAGGGFFAAGGSPFEMPGDEAAHARSTVDVDSAARVSGVDASNPFGSPTARPDSSGNSIASARSVPTSPMSAHVAFASREATAQSHGAAAIPAASPASTLPASASWAEDGAAAASPSATPPSKSSAPSAITIDADAGAAQHVYGASSASATSSASAGVQAVAQAQALTPAQPPAAATPSSTHSSAAAHMTLPPTPSGLTSLGALAQPSPPTLHSATINALTVRWAPVDGATGYYLDYEARSQVGTADALAEEGAWLGVGGRVVVAGGTLITGTSARITGLQKNAEYVARVTAVRKRHVVLDGVALEQSVESAPSLPSTFLRTLNPGAEIARLTAANARLTAENERIPVLEASLAELDAERMAQVGALHEELHSTQEQLSASIAEISRLETALSQKITALDAAEASIRSLHATLETRSGELGETRAEGRHLKEVVAQRTAELAEAHAEMERLNAALRDKAREVESANAEVAHVRSVVSAREADVSALRSKLGDTEAALAAKEKMRAELHSRLSTQTSQLSAVSGDKEVLISKLTEDLAKVMGEMQRVQNQLHKAQDTVTYLEPHAKLVIDLYEKQRAWDREHEEIMSGASPFGKMGALRKLGPRPTLTL